MVARLVDLIERFVFLSSSSTLCWLLRRRREQRRLLTCRSKNNVCGSLLPYASPDSGSATGAEGLQLFTDSVAMRRRASTKPQPWNTLRLNATSQAGLYCISLDDQQSVDNRLLPNAGSGTSRQSEKNEVFSCIERKLLYFRPLWWSSRWIGSLCVSVFWSVYLFLFAVHCAGKERERMQEEKERKWGRTALVVTMFGTDWR